LKFPFFIARRYLFSKKTYNIINIVSGISALGIGVGTMALVVVLSAFNGLEDLVGTLYSNFDPDIKVMPARGKRLKFDEDLLEKINTYDFVDIATPTLEEVMLLKYRDAQVFVSVKGVYPEFIALTALDSMMYEGNTKLTNEGVNHIILGFGIADKLNIFLSHIFEPVNVYAARREASIRTAPEEAFLIAPVYPSGIFSVNPDFDYKYALVSYDFVAELLNTDREASAIEIGLKKGFSPDKAASDLASSLGDSYVVKTRYQLNEVLYKTNNTEKWVTFLILTFILIIAAFNLIGAITMLILDKKKDMFMLWALGARQQTLRSIFMMEGLLITALGGGLGLFGGFALCMLQQHVGLVRLQEGSIAEFYPVIVEGGDMLFIASVVAIIGIIASWLPARYALRNNSRHISD
jgi:lipoprotein-releasing system permease protein